MSIGQVIVPYARIQEAYEQDPSGIEEAVHQGTGEVAAAGDALERARLLAAWNNAMGELRDDDKGESVLSSPPNGLASRVQTLLARKALELNRVKVIQGEQTVQTAQGNVLLPPILEVQFDNKDFLGWLQMSWKLIFKPNKFPWVNPPAVAQTIDDDACITIFSDWGTALYGAPVIATSVAALKRCDVALHLGDTYYSGADDEIRDRLVGDWPKCDAKTVSRTLNGNHEMYSGGTGYFYALTQAPFNQPASVFALQNTNWLLLCLDTAYVDFDLDIAQVIWMKSVIAAAGKRKVILFSHHQPYSQLDSQGPKLQAALGDLLNSQRIFAWFFGHEHRLVLYDAHGKWGVKARCVGNGGFPAFRDNFPGGGGSAATWIRLPPKPGVPAAEILDGSNPYVTDDPQRYSPHGYLTLDFQGPQAFETYYSPNGGIFRPRTAL
jgi:Calcineurin-like phosphoesterase